MQNVKAKTAAVRSYFKQLAKEHEFTGRIYTDKLKSGLRSVKMWGIFYATRDEAIAAANAASVATGCKFAAIKAQTSSYYGFDNDNYTIRAYV